MDNLGDKVDSKFRYVLLAAKRADQIMRGARPRLEADSTKTARVAMEEVRQNKIEWGYGPAPQPDPKAAGEDESEAGAEVH